MKTCRGICAFGFNDSVNGHQAESLPEDIPSTVVVSRMTNGTRAFLTGHAAALSRIETGFHWPVESRLQKMTPGHRMPVALMWERFVNDRGRASQIGPTRTRVEEILHAHVESLCDFNDGAHNVVAIPNTLSTASQERLLRMFSHRDQVHLLWRPIAATLGWLEQLPQDVRPSDGWVAVIYLGLDGFEFTKVELDTASHSRYVVPMRSRPKRQKVASLSGFELGWSALKNVDSELNFDGLWQGTLRFPEVWNWLRKGSRGAADLNERIYSRHGGWNIWEPAFAISQYGYLRFETMADSLYDLVKRKKSAPSPYAYSRALHPVNWNGKLSDLLKSALPSTEGCVAMIVCGALAPANGSLPEWLMSWGQRAALTPSVTPLPGRVFCAGNELISHGCQVYGARLLWNEEHPDQRIPTYYDTLPQISLQVAQDEELVWEPLFDQEYCEGGQTAHNTLDVFSLRANSTSVEIWLKMSDEDEDEDDIDNLEETPYRYSLVRFEKSYPEAVPLDLVASMQPSSGYATVFFRAQQDTHRDIVRGQGVHLNFEEMEPKLKKDLPVIKRSYPAVRKREAIKRMDSLRRALLRSVTDKELDRFRDLLVTPIKVVGEGYYPFGYDGSQYLLTDDELVDLQSKLDSLAEKDKLWISRVTWMWSACPPKVKAQVIANLRLRSCDWFQYGYASRVVSTDEEKALFWQTTQYKAKEATVLRTVHPWFAREFVRFVNFREETTQMMANDRATIDKLLSALSETYRNPHCISRNMLFYLSMLGVLLRIRKVNSSFLRSDADIARWESNIRYLKQTAEREAAGNNGLLMPLEQVNPRLAEYMTHIRDYLLGCGNDVPILVDSLDEADD